MDLESEIDDSLAYSEFTSFNPPEPENGLILEIPEEDEKIMETFGNHVIVENIMAYLDHTSIKYLGSTCHTLRTIIRSNSGFIHRSKFVIANAKPTGIRCSLKPFTLRPSDFPWKHVVIQMVDWSKKDFKAIIRLLSRVESLGLFLEHEYYNNSSHPHLKERVTTILNTLTNIKRLTIGEEVLDRLVNLKSNFAVSSELTQIEKNLKGLEALNFTNGLDSHSFPISSDPASFKKMVTTLAHFPAALTSFTFRTISFQERSGSNELKLSTGIVSILEQHRESLRNLVLDGCVWNYNILDPIVFPNLKEMSLVANGDDITNVVNFLVQQPPLEDLSLKFEGSTSSGLPLHSSLLSHGPHLKRFSLTWRLLPRMQPPPMPFHDDDWESDSSLEDLAPPPPRNPALPPQPVEAQWDFSILQNFGRLEELRVYQVAYPLFRMHDVLAERDAQISVCAILSAIPDGIRKIHLSGMPPVNWVPASSDLIIESLGRFSHLNVLNLVQCPTAVDDKVLAYICSNLKQLRELGFSHCDQVTDVGLTGKENGVIVRPGLKSLTSLQKLRILCCESLTSEALLEAITFRDLRELTLIIECTVHQDLFVKIGAQNKSLEVLEISDNIALIHVMVLPDLDRVLKSQSQRFRKLLLTRPPPPFLNGFSNENDEDLDESEYSGSDDEDDFDVFDYNSDFPFA